MPYGGNPASSTADELRFMIGDTDVNKPLLTDGEVEYLLGKYSRIACAAYHGAVSVRNKNAGKMNKTIGSARLEYTSVVQNLDPVIEALAKQCGVTGVYDIGPPNAGGIDSRPKIAAADFDNPKAIDP